MHEIHIDIETYSATSINSGVYRYSEDADFEILLFGYSVDDEEVHVVDLASGESIPDEILAALEDNNITKWAYNATFERICLSRYLYGKTEKFLDPKGWKCSMTWAIALGLPFSLKDVGAILHIANQKLDTGKDLIRYFCVPCKATKKNGGRLRNLYYHDKAKWQLFKEYNKRDVEAELAISNRLAKYELDDAFWREYQLSESINDTGVLVDLPLAQKAIKIANNCKEIYIKTLQNLTNLDNPNSVVQLKNWLNSNSVEADSLGKKDVAELLNLTNDATVEEVLRLRQLISKSSVRKYEAMMSSVCSDGRLRGMFMFYGANRSGRFSSKIVQLQNLPQNHLSDLSFSRELVKSGNQEALELLYTDIPDTLSQLIRTAFIPAVDHKFIVSDYSAIEARVLAWYSGEQWRIRAFKENQDIYCASATQMFGVPVVKGGINGELRAKGKIAELALGYGGSIGALTNMGALELGLEEDELMPLVESWRSANPAITKFWQKIDKAVRLVITGHQPIRYRGLTFSYQAQMLFIKLPSGRSLAYVKPEIRENKITYFGTDATRKYSRIETYGPKLVENIVQATARDLLLNALSNLSTYQVVMHIHDEVVVEVDSSITKEQIKQIMVKSPMWAKGLLLNADAYECDFYMKD